MPESLFLTVNQWMTGSMMLAAAGCFLWGVISVLFSPCHLASIPLIVGYVAGQSTMVRPRQAGVYSVLFTAGLFITIALVGTACAFLGRMLGDVGGWWQVLIGVILIWISLDMMGVGICAVPGTVLYRLNLKGKWGAFVLGLGYGLLSGSCTFGFIAPVLAIITVQEKVATGLVLIILFALGHCLPIALAGSFVASVKRLVESRVWSGAGAWFRKLAGVTIAGLGVYFIASPFLL